MNEVQTVKQGVHDLASKVPSAITNQAEKAEAESMLVAITKKRKEAEKFFKEKFIDPAKLLLKGHQDEAKLVIQPLNDAEAMLRKGLSVFNQAEQEKARKEQERLNKLYEKRVEKAIEKGKDIEEVKGPVVAYQPPKTVQTDAGAVSYRTVTKLIIDDEGKIPDTFMVITRAPNRAMIQAALKAKQEVPGCRLEETQELAVR